MVAPADGWCDWSSASIYRDQVPGGLYTTGHYFELAFVLLHEQAIVQLHNGSLTGIQLFSCSDTWLYSSPFDFQQDIDII